MKDAIKRHQQSIKVLEAIISFEKRKKSKLQSAANFKGLLPELSRKYLNDVDTIDKCIDRLEKKYLSLNYPEYSIK